MAAPSLDIASPPGWAARLYARVKAMRATGDSGRAQRVAGSVFLVRVASALIALGSQVLLARWMGSFEYGVYIYAWTWVLMIGALTDTGLSSSARRFIPEYTARADHDRLRGFIAGSRRLAFATALAIGGLGAVLVTLLAPRLDGAAIVPLYLACATLPIYGLVQLQAGIAQSYDWPNLALIPFYVWRQLALTLLMGLAWIIGAPTGAVTAMAIAAVTAWMVTIGQHVVLARRLKAKVAPGPRRYAVKTWLATSLPLFVVEGFYLLLTYVDILALAHFGAPDQVAIYYAAARLLAVVAFVYFAVAGAATHRFTQFHVAGDREGLAAFFAQTARWSFWPSLILCAAILAAGKPLLALFGPQFVQGYGVMLILAVGMLARAAVGPAERLLAMLGVRTPCAIVYAAAFAINLALCTALVPRIGVEGAAVATATALVVESLALFALARRRLG